MSNDELDIPPRGQLTTITTRHVAIVMSIMEEIWKLSRNGCDDVLLIYICENYDELECELNVRSLKSAIVVFALTATLK